MNILSFVIHGTLACVLAVLVTWASGVHRDKRKVNSLPKLKINRGVEKKYSDHLFKTVVIFLLLFVNILLLTPWVMIYRYNMDESYLIEIFFFFTAVTAVTYFFAFFSRDLEKGKTSDPSN